MKQNAFLMTQVIANFEKVVSENTSQKNVTPLIVIKDAAKDILEDVDMKKKVCAFDHDNLDDKKDGNKNVDVDERIRKDVEKELKDFKTTIENTFLEKIDSIEKSCEEQSIKCKNLNKENKKIAKELEIKMNEYDAKVKELETIQKCMEEQKLKIESLEIILGEINYMDSSITKSKDKIKNKTEESISKDDAADSSKRSVKNTKLTKANIEEILIDAFVNDVDQMTMALESSKLCKEKIKCKKCDFVTYSEGMIRRHRVLKHKKQGTSQNMILGFESDMQEYSSILKWIGKDLNEFKCEECPFASYSRGKLAFHKLSNHQR